LKRKNILAKTAHPRGLDTTQVTSVTSETPATEDREGSKSRHANNSSDPRNTVEGTLEALATADTFGKVGKPAIAGRLASARRQKQ
jgi:hypothetical protein